MRKAMLVCLFMMCGCAAGASMVSDYEACRANPECVQKMESSRVIATQATAAATPEGLIPTLVGYFVSLVVGVFSGHKLTKKAV